MDQGKILIVNLSKGLIGEDNASVLGSFLVQNSAGRDEPQRHCAWKTAARSIFTLTSFRTSRQILFAVILSGGWRKIRPQLDRCKPICFTDAGRRARRGFWQRWHYDLNARLTRVTHPARATVRATVWIARYFTDEQPWKFCRQHDD